MNMQRSRDWLDQAKQDLEHARQSIDLGHFEWSCFAVQQATEKALKALYLYQGTVAWGHSVFDLLDGLKKLSRH
jgi:HEPN domain-containing protein